MVTSSCDLARAAADIEHLSLAPSKHQLCAMNAIISSKDETGLYKRISDKYYLSVEHDQLVWKPGNHAHNHKKIKKALAFVIDQLSSAARSGISEIEDVDGTSILLNQIFDKLIDKVWCKEVMKHERTLEKAIIDFYINVNFDRPLRDAEEFIEFLRTTRNLDEVIQALSSEQISAVSKVLASLPAVASPVLSPRAAHPKNPLDVAKSNRIKQIITEEAERKEAAQQALKNVQAAIGELNDDQLHNMADELQLRPLYTFIGNRENWLQYLTSVFSCPRQISCMSERGLVDAADEFAICCQTIDSFKERIHAWKSYKKGFTEFLSEHVSVQTLYDENPSVGVVQAFNRGSGNVLGNTLANIKAVLDSLFKRAHDQLQAKGLSEHIVQDRKIRLRECTQSPVNARNLCALFSEIKNDLWNEKL